MTIKSIGRYHIVRTLAAGDEGTLYEGFDAANDRPVHILAASRDSLAPEDYAGCIGRYRRHVHAAARLAHAGIVPAYEAGESGGLAYLVTAPAPPQSLRERMQDGLAWPVADAIRVISELAGILDFMHARGIVCRDVKPASILLAADGRVHLADFMLVKFLQPSEPIEREEEGALIGTPAYMSPEQITGDRLDGRSDIFSAGVVLYMLLTGQRPFRGDGAWQIAKNILQTAPEEPSALNSLLPAPLDAVVLKALAKDPAERYATGSELAAALARAQHGASEGDDPAYIGSYRIDSRIEARGAEVCYVGFDTKFVRPVLVHALFRSRLGGDVYAAEMAGYRTAARATALVPHRGVLQIHDAGEIEGIGYRVTERFHADSLHALFERGERFPLARAVAIVISLLDTLEHVHAAGVLHRGIRAQSVLLGAGDEVKLAGFEMARLPSAEAAPMEDLGEGTPLGKVSIMAPEQIAGGPVDERADLFQVGVLLYRLLTGQPAFSAPGVWTLAKRILQDDPVSPSDIDASIPRNMDSVIGIALAKSPDQRFPSARQFAYFVRSALEDNRTEIVALHILFADLEFGASGPDGEPWPDAAYEELAALSRDLSRILTQHGGVLGKLIGTEFFTCFRRGEAIVDALRKCSDLYRHSAFAVRCGVRFKLVVHHGIVVVRDGDAFGDNVGVAASMLSHLQSAGIYFSALAVAALPAADQAMLRVSDVNFERFTRNLKIAELVRSPVVHELD